MVEHEGTSRRSRVARRRPLSFTEGASLFGLFWLLCSVPMGLVLLGLAAVEAGRPVVGVVGLAAGVLTGGLLLSKLLRFERKWVGQSDDR